MRRGDLVVVVLSGNLGKPRPALVIQSDLYAETAGVMVVPFTSHIDAEIAFRIIIEPSASNGLRERSQLMVDKVTTLPRDKVGKIIGILDNAAIQQTSAQLSLLLGLVS
ncbi:type II toxin-antitoxin system PemK/MazF family toxin [Devosia rhizoryzae]|uniref:Type II toxin-antitoxin system PemK/MazF family toxin n=1 Tax=Devosia rhizoryzae TaxID=2774137 RepID=A0ABX7C2X4_9HYPH|nr:type II toxin-antitoxin system PemK/MazF family toxin [Devosia rhizoryzae]QQR38128.1 type II toxin-antitoxin system PemK/MazF family toxin [Devosia rhizoryzae]